MPLVRPAAPRRKQRAWNGSSCPSSLWTVSMELAGRFASRRSQASPAAKTCRFKVLTTPTSLQRTHDAPSGNGSIGRNSVEPQLPKLGVSWGAPVKETRHNRQQRRRSTTEAWDGPRQAPATPSHRRCAPDSRGSCVDHPWSETKPATEHERFREDTRRSVQGIGPCARS